LFLYTANVDESANDKKSIEKRLTKSWLEDISDNPNLDTLAILSNKVCFDIILNNFIKIANLPIDN
jgi:hypothetical protein